MLRLPQPPTMAMRVDAAKPITAELLAAVSGQSIELAETLLAAWLGAIHAVTGHGVVIVFEHFVVGRPDPFLLEAVHQLRTVRRAEAHGLFDHEEEQWYADHVDDDEAVYDPPTIADRVIEALRSGQEWDRLLDEDRFARLVSVTIRSDRSTWLPLSRLSASIEHLALELADAIRFGDAVPVDARLIGERVDGLRWSRLGIQRVGIVGMLQRGWELRENLTADDATYVSVAEALDCALLTADALLARAPGPTCPISLVRN